MAREQKWEHGQPVRIEGTVADVETGARVTGAGRVCGDNPTCRNDRGTRMVNVEMADGSMVAVPERALRKESSR